MGSRLAGRLVTSRWSFLACGLYDFTAFLVAWGRLSLIAKLTRRGST